MASHRRTPKAATTGAASSAGGEPAAAGGQAPLRHRMVQVVAGRRVRPGGEVAGLAAFGAAHPELVQALPDATWLGERVAGSRRPEDAAALAAEARLRAALPAGLAASTRLLPFSVAVYETDVAS